MKRKGKDGKAESINFAWTRLREGLHHPFAIRRLKIVAIHQSSSEGEGEEIRGDRLAYRVPVLIIRADKGTVIESVP